MQSNNWKKKDTVVTIAIIVGIIALGIGASYAVYTANINGQRQLNETKAATLNVTSSLTSEGTSINTDSLGLIDASEYTEKGESLAFTVTNQSTSTVKAKYTVNITDMSLSKNLFSEYFKWALKVNDTVVATGNFADSSKVAEGYTLQAADEPLTGLTKPLISSNDARVLDIGATDNLVLYVWLENNPSVDQLYLTNGSFSGKLSVDATPYKAN